LINIHDKEGNETFIIFVFYMYIIYFRHTV